MHRSCTDEGQQFKSLSIKLKDKFNTKRYWRYNLMNAWPVTSTLSDRKHLPLIRKSVKNEANLVNKKCSVYHHFIIPCIRRRHQFWHRNRLWTQHVEIHAEKQSVPGTNQTPVIENWNCSHWSVSNSATILMLLQVLTIPWKDNVRVLQAFKKEKKYHT